jgi:hypothetical protein
MSAVERTLFLWPFVVMVALALGNGHWAGIKDHDSSPPPPPAYSGCVSCVCVGGGVELNFEEGPWAWDSFNPYSTKGDEGWEYEEMHCIVINDILTEVNALAYFPH